MNFFIFAIFCSVAALAFAQDVLLPGDQMDFVNGKKLFSADGRFRLDMQTDGNLVIYNVGTGNHVWGTKTSGSGANKAVMQRDGQFRLYNQAGEIKWSSYTGDSGSYVKMQNDGNLVIYSPKGYPVWAAATGWGSTKATA
jgi:hypothetical protein